VQLHYDSAGDGPLVVLLHGFPEYRASWRRQLPALAAAGFRAVAPDLRGYGLSPKPRGVDSYRIPLLVDDVAELIRALGGGPCVLVGHDWGAFVAWFVAMIHPELVRRLVILNVPHPAAFARELHRSTRQKLLASYQLFFRLPLLPELLLRLFGRPLMRRAGRFEPEEIDDYARTWRGSLTPMFHYYRALPRASAQLRRAIRPIDVPVLMIWGAGEPVFLRSTTENVEEWVPRLRFERIPRAGHFVQTDAAERVNELLLSFAREG
jgi:pimeloyl-ACP methyl ester carboxylesterase